MQLFYYGVVPYDPERISDTEAIAVIEHGLNTTQILAVTTWLLSPDEEGHFFRQQTFPGVVLARDLNSIELHFAAGLLIPNAYEVGVIAVGGH